MNPKPKIPLLVPRLPVFDRIAPYFRQIDQNHWYTNGGPLLKELEKRLAGHFEVPAENLVVMANGTEALTIGLLCLERPRGARYCLLPSWTFAATPLSAVHAGLTPVFVDADPGQWMITPETVRKAISELNLRPGEIHSVMAVSPFGAPVKMTGWAAFQEETGIPVLVDAAASFDALANSEAFRPSAIPVMVSLHATKSFGIGEGAFLLSKNADFILKARKMINFGFWGGHEALVAGKNGKLSEYGCAVGHAELDGWPEKREAWRKSTEGYLAFRKVFEEWGISFMPGYGEGWISSYCNVAFDSEKSKEAARQTLSSAGIEVREWWGKGCHGHPALKHYPQAGLDETRRLAQSVLALPFYVGMTQEQLDQIVGGLSGLFEKR